MEANALDGSGWNSINSMLPSNWRQLAEEFGLCRSQPSKNGERAKLKDPAVLLRLVLHHVGTETPLDLTVAQADAIGLVSVSKVALHLRMRSVGPWLARLAASIAQTDETFAAERWGGYRIHCTDATTGCRPGATGTTFRVHYRIEAATMRPVAFHFTDVHGGEMLRRFTIEDGDLDLLDRGYCTAADIQHSKRKHGEVIVRFTRGSLPLFDDGGVPIDIKPRVLAIKRAGRIRSWKVTVHGPGGDRIEGRIVALRLTDGQAAKAIERLGREKALKDISDEDREWSRYVVVFTTVPPARLSAKMVIELYRLRWLVELQIKRDKSIGGLDRLPNFRDDTIESWVCGKLLLFAIARRLAEARFSPCAEHDPSDADRGGSGADAPASIAA
jgi:hypothetical protein